MTDQLNPSIARIYSLEGEVVGAGFLISETHLLTCAHVILEALGMPEDTTASPSGSVLLDFPLVTPAKKYKATVVRWRPPNLGPEPSLNYDEEDIAVLRLELAAGETSNIRPIRLKQPAELWGHPFRVLGFPSSHDQGVWSKGKLLARLGNTWIQMEAENQLGYFVAPGFSGAAVWDDDVNVRGVVGMVVASDKKAGSGAAFLIPADTLIRILPTPPPPPPPPPQPPKWKWLVKILVCVVAVALVAAFPVYKIKVAYWPSEYPIEKKYEFFLTDKARLAEAWQLTPGSWDLEKGEGELQTDGALLVKGSQTAMPKDLGAKVFYNYRAEFKVRFKEGDKVAWMLRAQRDGHSGYLFEMEKKDSTLILRGKVVEGKGTTRDLAPNEVFLGFSKCCNPTDGLHVYVKVVGNRFTYCVNFESTRGHSSPDNGTHSSAEFVDSDSTFNWGIIGFLVPDGVTPETNTAGVMKIEYLYLMPLTKDGHAQDPAAERNSPCD